MHEWVKSAYVSRRGKLQSMINHQHKFIFIHINKTGGTSIEKTFEASADLRNVANKHASLEDYRKKYPLKSRTYFKFGFVRNPWDWLVSRYHWSRDHQRLFDFSFDEMLRLMKLGVPLSADAPWLEKQALQPQSARLSLRGAVAVDFVGRYERLQPDFDVVCERIGIPPTALPHVFATRRKHYVDYYTDETRETVEQLYAPDIAAFGYRFSD